MSAQTGSPGLVAPSAYDPLPGLPPNMSVAAAVSAGLIPANVLMTNLGTKDSRPGRAVAEVLADAGKNGMGANFVALGGSPNGNCAGSGSPNSAAGGDNQTSYPSSGEQTTLPANAAASVPTIAALPQFQG